MRNYSKFPCGDDGLSFPNGLPHLGEDIEVKTVWNPNWHGVEFRAQVSGMYPEKGHYDWFGIYSKPRVSKGENPIVTEWRYAEKATPCTP